MRRPGSTQRVVIAAAAVAAAAVVVPAAQARTVAKSPASIRAYWTPARMRHALPASTLESGSAPFRTSAAHRRGPLHSAVPNPRARGVRTAGKVFFRKGLLDYECSGTVVRSPSRRLVLSAGHCAYVDGLGGGYGKNWMFVPAYSKTGSAVHEPFGEWPAASLHATQGWIDSALTGGDSRYDVSAAILAKRHGAAIQDVVGGRTPRFGAKRRVTYDAVGYPAEGQFNGNTEFQCRSPLKKSDPSEGLPATLGIACDMTGGSSGGGWIVKNRYIESVTSYSYETDPNTLYGPYFGAAIEAFYNSVKNG